MDDQKNKENGGDSMTLEYVWVKTIEELVKQIAECEGKHTQQAVYSTFHSGLTQVCFGCRKIRSNIFRGDSTTPELLEKNI